MSKVYNDFYFIANSFSSFLQISSSFLPKTCLNILPDILTAMLSSSSCVTKNISLHCKGQKFDFIQPDSVSRRIRRFFNNEHYNPYELYNSIIKHVISKFSCKHSDNTLHIVFDHMFKSEQCLISQGIKYVSDLFKDKPNYKLVFLADRWFGSTSLLSFIHSLGHTYVVRAKSSYNVWYFDFKEDHVIKTKIDKLFHYKYKATYYENISLSDNRFITNVVFSASKSVSISNKTSDGEVEPWILLTNADSRRAIKWYGYRFGAIEFLFKDQKSNGFNLEKSSTRNLQAFSMMYACINICILYLTCISTYYTRHKKKFYSDVHIRYYGIVKGKHVRKMSIFQVGLTLFKLAFCSTKKILLPFNFVLTDV